MLKYFKHCCFQIIHLIDTWRETHWDILPAQALCSCGMCTLACCYLLNTTAEAEEWSRHIQLYLTYVWKLKGSCLSDNDSFAIKRHGTHEKRQQNLLTPLVVDVHSSGLHEYHGYVFFSPHSTWHVSYMRLIFHWYASYTVLFKWFASFVRLCHSYIWDHQLNQKLPNCITACQALDLHLLHNWRFCPMWGKFQIANFCNMAQERVPTTVVNNWMPHVHM